MGTGTKSQLRHLPAIGKLLNRPEVQECLAIYPAAVVTDALRLAVKQHRDLILDESGEGPPLIDSILDMSRQIIVANLQPSLRRVINATGIVLHTGLGRAPLSKAAIQAIQSGAGGYCNLEMNLETGERGRRIAHLSELLCELTGAEASTVVNNNAAATLLILNTLARDRRVVVSRGQLIEIGGSFRLPDIMKASGAQLREVGTTNRTRLSDYENAIEDQTAALMRVHTSNYRIMGFTQDVPIGELVALGKKYDLPVIDDLGSGVMLNLQAAGLAEEPDVQASVQAGADLVCFSGDKLLGGPQAGIIVGKAKYVQAIQANPLMRTYRIGKLTLLALEATLRTYLDEDQAKNNIPALSMLFASLESIKNRAGRLMETIGSRCDGENVEVAEDVSYAGGGSLPTQQLPTWVVRWQPTTTNAEEAAQQLRRRKLPIVARIHKDAVVFDCRTIGDEEVFEISDAIGDTTECPRSS